MKRGEEPDTRPEMLFRLILDTGIKKSEAIALTPKDIDRTNPKAPFLLVNGDITLLRTMAELVT